MKHTTKLIGHCNACKNEFFDLVCDLKVDDKEFTLKSAQMKTKHDRAMKRQRTKLTLVSSSI